MTPPLILLGGWTPLFDSACLRDCALIDSSSLLDSISDPARGWVPLIDLAWTPPVTLLEG
jgi:hypothetical protein